MLGDSHAINLFNMFGYSKQFSTVVGSTQASCRPHGCAKNIPNQYLFFKEKILPIIKSEDIVIFHQSGSYLMADRKGVNDSQRTFDEGVGSVDVENILIVGNFLNEIANNVEAKVIWLGPFLEYRYNPKEIVRQVQKGGSVEQKYLTVHPNSPILFNKLEEVFNSIEGNKFRYVSFKEFYEVEHIAVVIGVDGGKCFQFRDKDHFTECGERRIAESANYDFLTK